MTTGLLAGMGLKPRHFEEAHAAPAGGHASVVQKGTAGYAPRFGGVAERLLVGRERYGNLHLATDARNFRVEALEEAADGLVYAAAGLMRAGGKSG